MSNYVRTADFAAKDGLASGAALKALKGTELGLEFDNIVTMSATKVDSASNASLLSLVLTGSTVPANGIYLPAANTIGLASNSTLRGSVNATGNWTFVAPSSGATATINMLDGSAGALLFDSGAPTAGYRLQFQQNGAQKAYIGFGTNVFTGAAVADFGISTVSSVMRFSNNNGANTQLQINGNLVQAIDQGLTPQDVGWRDVPQNVQNGNYTTVMADRGKSIVSNGAGGNTLTIAANASVAYPLGTTLVFVNRTGASVSIAIASDSLILAGTSTTGTRTLSGLNSMATAYKSDATVWLISGPGLT